jgi:glutathione synthase/RimK-type ligase-like ATP-grasp enzyme
VVDTLQRIWVAENKLRQLRVAKEVGLKIPRTFVTNDPKQVREFFQELKASSLCVVIRIGSFITATR